MKKAGLLLPVFFQEFSHMKPLVNLVFEGENSRSSALLVYSPDREAKFFRPTGARFGVPSYIFRNGFPGIKSCGIAHLQFPISRLTPGIIGYPLYIRTAKTRQCSQKRTEFLKIICAEEPIEVGGD